MDSYYSSHDEEPSIYYTPIISETEYADLFGQSQWSPVTSGSDLLADNFSKISVSPLTRFVKLLKIKYASTVYQNI